MLMRAALGQLCQSLASLWALHASLGPRAGIAFALQSFAFQGTNQEWELLGQNHFCRGWTSSSRTTPRIDLFTSPLVLFCYFSALQGALNLARERWYLLLSSHLFDVRVLKAWVFTSSSAASQWQQQHVEAVVSSFSFLTAQYND